MANCEKHPEVELDAEGKCSVCEAAPAEETPAPAETPAQ